MRAGLLLSVLLAGCSSSLPTDPMPIAAAAAAEATTDNGGKPPRPAASASSDDDTAMVTRLPASGSLSGRILYPDGDAPALRICAIHGSGDLYGCVQTRAGTRRYRIGPLPPTSYRVVARARAGKLHVGGFVRPLRCPQAPCPAALVTVNIAPGEDVAAVDLNGFYPARKDFPKLPADAP